MKRSALVKLRALFAILITTFASGAHAALRCESAFVDQGVLHARLSSKLETALEESRHLVHVEDDGHITISSAPHLLSTIEIAREYLASFGVEARTTLFEGLPSLEIVANRSSAWNRMADSTLKNYGVKLVFSPHALAAKRANALWDSSTKTILISRESLRIGHGERQNLEEFGHMKSELTKAQSPNIFSGFLEVASSDQRLTPTAEIYGLSMELDEVARLAQNYHHLGLEVSRGDSDQARTSILNTAKVGSEILSIAEASVRFNKRVSARVAKDVLGSGPLLLDDGSVDPERAYVVTGEDTQISIEEKANGTLRFRLEDNDRTSEIWISADSGWHQLLPQLRLNNEAAQVQFQKKFSALVQEWELRFKPSLAALQIATKAILTEADSNSNAELSELLLKPRRVVAPHLRRSSP